MYAACPNYVNSFIDICQRFLSASLARAHASTDHFFFLCLQTLMKLTTPVDSEFGSLALQQLKGHMFFFLFPIHMSFLHQTFMICDTE